MKKRIISTLIATCMIIAMLPQWSFAVGEDELISKLKTQTSDSIVDTFYNDFDNDGQYEMFAMTGTYYDDDDPIDMFLGDVWFVSYDNISKINTTSDAIAMSGGYEPKTVTQGDQNYFCYNRMFGNGQTYTSIFTIDNGNVKTTNFGGYLQYSDKIGWYATNRAYDRTISKEDFNNGFYYGIGRSWKNYWYYYDEETAEFKEYGGTEITKEQFCKFEGAQAILNNIDGQIYNILYRANGIININILKESEMNYETLNILVGYDDTKVWTIDDQHTETGSDYRSPIYSGIYVKALNPEMAVYPEFFEPANDKSLKIYTDAVSYSAVVGENFILGASSASGDNSGISFSVEDKAIVRADNINEQDGIQYCQFNARKSGSTQIKISDSRTGESAVILFTVNSKTANTYTVSSIPQNSIDGVINNIYNFNGIYVDNYSYKSNENGDVNVQFTAYNSKYYYSTVEVYDKDGKYIYGEVIDKYAFEEGFSDIQDSMHAIVIEPFQNANWFSYRNGMISANKDVSLTIPKGGYMRITNDTCDSSVCALVNAIDIVMKSINVAQMVDSTKTPEAAMEFFNNYGDEILKEYKKNAITFPIASTDGLKHFVASLNNIFSTGMLKDMLLFVAKSSAEGLKDEVILNALTLNSNPAGPALDITFKQQTAENLIMQIIQTAQGENKGSIVIQNPIKDIRLCSDVTVNTSIDDQTALSVYRLEQDDDKLIAFRDSNNIGDNRHILAYDINLIKDGKSVQPSKGTTVTIKLPDDLENLTGEVIVYREDANGNITKLNGISDGQTVTFETDHFSIYYLVFDSLMFDDDGDYFSDTTYLNERQQEAISYAVNNNIMQGYEDGSIRPFNTITRAEFATIMCRYYDYSVDTKCNFDDSKDHWASQYIKACVDKGAINGIGNNKFDPDGIITYEQALKIFTILNGYTDGIDIDDLGGYPDAYIKIADNLRLTEGFTVMDVGQGLPRVDVAMMIYNSSMIEFEPGNINPDDFNNGDINGDRDNNDVAFQYDINDGSLCVLDSGFGFAGAITSDSELYTWGVNDFYQLGTGRSINKAEPECIMSGVKKYFAGVVSAALINEDDELYMWGDNSLGKFSLLDEDIDNIKKPTKVMDDVAYCSLSHGTQQCFILKTNGDLYGWGGNENGQLGNGTTKKRYTPQKIMEDVKYFWAEDDYVLAIKTNGDLYSWGRNRWGTLGNGTTDDSYEPIKIMSNIKLCKGGCLGYSMALTNDGELYAWGAKSNDLFGVDASENIDIITKPQKIMDNVAYFDTYNKNTLVITNDRQLYSFGVNGWGVLGNGDDWETCVEPQKIMDNVVDCSIGDDIAVAVKANGDLYVWGACLGAKEEFINTPTKIMSNIRTK